MRVVKVEVVCNDGHRQTSCKDACKSAHWADDVACPRLRVHISVADGGEGDDDPPEALWDVLKRLIMEELGVVDGYGEDEHDDEDEDEEHGKLAQGGAQSQHEDFHASVVAI